MTTFTFNGIAYDLDDFLGYGLFDRVTAGTGDTNIPRWVAAHFDAIADAASNGQSTSTTSLAIGTGTKVFTTATTMVGFAGMRGVAINSSDASEKMYFEVTSISGTTLTTSVDITEGSGTIATWNIKLGVGPSGSAGTLSGNMSGNIDVNSYSIVSSSNGDINIVPNGTGKINVQDKQIQRAKFIDSAETRTTPSSSSGTLTLDMTNGNVFAVTLTENIPTLQFTNWPSSGDEGFCKVKFIQDATGGRSITFPAAVRWRENGTPPTLTTTANAESTFLFTTDNAGTDIDGYLLADDLA
ncbi:MAG: hypothetical protein MI867_12440 [Pseudomonadales bacterium]|nr:hypothetical protein [Pseudomonadales bacterium]